VKAYDSVAAVLHYPFEYHTRWRKDGKKYICQYRWKRKGGRKWSKWGPIV
jgi:hypothetical protein